MQETNKRQRDEESSDTEPYNTEECSEQNKKRKPLPFFAVGEFPAGANEDNDGLQQSSGIFFVSRDEDTAFVLVDAIQRQAAKIFNNYDVVQKSEEELGDDQSELVRERLQAIQENAIFTLQNQHNKFFSVFELGDEESITCSQEGKIYWNAKDHTIVTSPDGLEILRVEHEEDADDAITEFGTDDVWKRIFESK